MGDDSVPRPVGDDAVGDEASAWFRTLSRREASRIVELSLVTRGAAAAAAIVAIAAAAVIVVAAAVVAAGCIAAAAVLVADGAGRGSVSDLFATANATRRGDGERERGNTPRRGEAVGEPARGVGVGAFLVGTRSCRGDGDGDWERERAGDRPRVLVNSMSGEYMVGD